PLLESGGSPCSYKFSIFFSGIFSNKVIAIDQMKFTVRQPFVEICGINWRHGPVSATVDNLHWCLYLRQNFAQFFEFRRIGPHVTHRFCESIAFVRREVVRSSGIADDITLELLNYVLDDLTFVNFSIRFEIGGKYPFT